MGDTALRSDALRSSSDGLALEVGLPWIRSLPLSCVLSLSFELDGRPVDGVRALLDGRGVELIALAEEEGWWFLQDRLVLTAPGRPGDGEHAVRVVLELLIPYLSAGPDRPLIVPVDLRANLRTGLASPLSV